MQTLLVIAAWLVIGGIIGMTLALMWRIKGTTPPLSEALPLIAGTVLLWPLVVAAICFFLLLFWDLLLNDVPLDSDTPPTR